MTEYERPKKFEIFEKYPVFWGILGVVVTSILFILFGDVAAVDRSAKLTREAEQVIFAIAQTVEAERDEIESRIATETSSDKSQPIEIEVTRIIQEEVRLEVTTIVEVPIEVTREIEVTKVIELPITLPTCADYGLEITSPNVGEIINGEVEVEGIFLQPLPSANNFIIMIVDIHGNRFWPKVRSSNRIESNNTWSWTGDLSPQPGVTNIAIALIGDSGRALVDYFLLAGKETKQFPAIETLTDDIEICDMVSIQGNE